MDTEATQVMSADVQTPPDGHTSTQLPSDPLLLDDPEDPGFVTANTKCAMAVSKNTSAVIISVAIRMTAVRSLSVYASSAEPAPVSSASQDIAPIHIGDIVFHTVGVSSAARMVCVEVADDVNQAPLLKMAYEYAVSMTDEDNPVYLVRLLIQSSRLKVLKLTCRATDCDDSIPIMTLIPSDGMPWTRDGIVNSWYYRPRLLRTSAPSTRPLLKPLPLGPVVPKSDIKVHDLLADSKLLSTLRSTFPSGVLTLLL